jgi:outer membrane protein TolC
MVDAYMLIRGDSAALQLARENYRLAEINYSAGVSTVSDVLQAHALLLQAENAVTDRRVTYLVARRRLADLRDER